MFKYLIFKNLDLIKNFKFQISNLVLVTLFLFIFPILLIVNAYDSSRSNNKFGIHLAQPDLNDLEKAAQLVNANGGDWGYVTLVLQDNDRDRNKWQEIFDRMRELRLIPIVRLATHPEGAIWPRPKVEDIDAWVHFLNSLNWVIKDRYIILFNEPNHANEWGGEVDPAGYAQIAQTFAQKLKERNADFFVMTAGLDASAPQAAPQLEDEVHFIRELVSSITPEQYNSLFSGWVSHSYPNPGFAGSPYAGGRGTINTYQWEQGILSSLGVKDLPVFITETGWDAYRVSQTNVASNFNVAYQNVWLPDSRVVAVTPFILNYQSEPFARFSWATMGNNGFYPVYFEVQNLPKRAGDPQIEDRGELVFNFPRELVSHSNYHFTIMIKNNGQAIWDKDYGYHLELEGFDPSLYFFSDLKGIKPLQEESVDLFIKTNSLVGEHGAKLSLITHTKKVAENPLWKFEVVPLPSLTFQTRLFPKLTGGGDDYELQIFDTHQQLVFKKSGLSVRNHIGYVSEVQNIILGKQYRVVILKPYYLPRQKLITFTRGSNTVLFRSMYPLDFSKDGKLGIDDLITLLRNSKLLLLFLPWSW